MTTDCLVQGHPRWREFFFQFNHCVSTFFSPLSRGVLALRFSLDWPNTPSAQVTKKWATVSESGTGAQVRRSCHSTKDDTKIVIETEVEPSHTSDIPRKNQASAAPAFLFLLRFFFFLPSPSITLPVSSLLTLPGPSPNMVSKPP